MEDADNEQEKYQSIMDMSPFNLEKGFRDPVITLQANSEQISKQAVEDCPTAILVDVPDNSHLCLTRYSLLNNKYDSCQQHDLVNCKCLIQDVKEQQYICYEGKKSSAIDLDDPCDSMTVKSQLSHQRLLRKTPPPSPQSMSSICKEASKIINDLNSAFLFDEDSPLCEETLPLPINFDFDSDGHSDHENLGSSPKSSYADICDSSNFKAFVSIQTEEEVKISEIIDKEIIGISNSVDNLRISEDQSYSTLSSSGPFDSQMSFSDGNECNVTSKQLKSMGTQVHSQNVNFSPSDKGTDDSFVKNSILCDEGEDDVFIKNSISSQGKENVPEKEEYKEILPSETLISIKTPRKSLIVSKRKIENNRKIKKLSSVKHGTDSRNVLNSNNATPPMKVGLKAPAKESLAVRKVQLKKTVSEMQPQIAPKMIPRSKSFQSQSTRESIFSFPKPHPVKRETSFSLNSGCKFSSSDVKHTFSHMATPSRRFSIATPLKSASAKKLPVTPALSSFQNPSFPRCTPQSGGARISFSKSWQQPNVSNSKGLRYQNLTSSSCSKSSISKTNSSELKKKSLCQSISTVPRQTSIKNALSTSNKKRFCSKLSLPSPLHAEQDKKLARVLFPPSTHKM